MIREPCKHFYIVRVKPINTPIACGCIMVCSTKPLDDDKIKLETKERNREYISHQLYRQQQRPKVP